MKGKYITALIIVILILLVYYSFKPRVKVKIQNHEHLQFVSDIHLEFYEPEELPNILPKIIKPNKNNNVALLGDIGYPHTKIYEDFISWCSKNFKRVFIIAGNHEYYNIADNKLSKKSLEVMKTIQEINEKIEDIEANYNNVHFLNRKKYIIHSNCSSEAKDFTSGVVILGATLWANIPPKYQEQLPNMMNDYKCIYYMNENNKIEKLTTAYVNKMHKKDLNWIKKQVEQANKNGQDVIILTHHAPSQKMEHDNPKKRRLPCGYSTNLDDFITQNPNIKYWLSGHTHLSKMTKIGNTDLISNCMGYKGQQLKADTKINVIIS